MAQITEELKAKAEVYHGDKLGKEKTQLLLEEVGLPNGLLPLKDISECGYVADTGFVWLKQKKRTDHFFESIGKVVSYAPEITAYVEKGRIRKVTGVKTRELLIWITVCEICLDGAAEEKMVCKTPAGLFRVFPTSAFQIKDVEGEKR